MDQKIAFVERRNVQKWFENKFKNLVFLELRKKKVEDVNGFLIKEAILYRDTSFDNFITLIHSQDIKMAFKYMVVRPETPNEKFNNHGSGFRAYQDVMDELYNYKVSLL